MTPPTSTPPGTTSPTPPAEASPYNRMQVCKGCGGVYPLYSERCHHCGKDSKYGTQGIGLLITIGMLLFALPFAVILMFFLF